jgi:hypothetical protein
MKLKKGSKEAKEFMASIRAKKKGAKKTAVKKTAVKKAPKKTAVKKASTHKDTKSHNVNISVVSGNINTGRKKLIENLSFLYGKLASQYLFAKTQKERKNLYKEMSVLKKELNNLTINKNGFYK